MAVPTLAELRLAIGRPDGTGPAAPLSQTELAERASISQSYLSQLEAGARRPSPRYLLRLAAALRMPPELLNQSIRETLRRHKLGIAQIRFLG